MGGAFGMIHTDREGQHYSESSFPRLGVRLSYLTQIIEDCGGISNLTGKTTNDVCEGFIKPWTSTKRQSYCNFLQSKYKEEGKAEECPVAVAGVFISHAWKLLFLDVVNALNYHFRSNPNIIIWFDLFSNNQHEAVILNFDWWCNTFKSAISEFQYVVMVLAPWKDPIPLRRAWCLFELYCSAVTKCKFEVAMSEYEIIDFIQTIKNSGVREEFLKLIHSIDCENSESSLPEDRERIFHVIKTTSSIGGFGKINNMVFEQLRNWIVKVIEYELIQIRMKEAPEIEIASVEFLLGNLYRTDGQLDRAIMLYEKALKEQQRVLGLEHADTLETMNALASVYQDVSEYKLAIQYFEECMQLREKTLGEDAIPTINSYHNLAYTYWRIGRLAEAEKFFIKCLEKRRLKFGLEYSYTLEVTNNLASLLMQQGNEERAKELYQDYDLDALYNRFTNQKGDTDQEYDILNYIAEAYTILKEYNKAEGILNQRLQLQKVKLGIDHADTLSTMRSLGKMYTIALEYDKAEEKFQLILQITTTRYGEDHPRTLRALALLADFFSHRIETRQQAIDLYQKCIEKQKTIFPMNHPQIHHTEQLLNDLLIIHK